MKKLFAIAVIVSVVLLVSVSVAFAHPVRAQAQPLDLLAVLFPIDFIKACLGVLAAIVLDLVCGVAVAIQQNKFEWSKLADFYRSKVIPVLLGWAVADIVMRLAAYYQLPVLEQFQPLGSAGLYVLVMASLVGQIATKFSLLRGDTPQAPGGA